MALKRDDLETLIFGGGSSRRYTQDSPIMPDVWLEYGENPDQRLDLLLIPHNESRAGALARELRERLSAERNTAHWRQLHPDAPRATGIAYNQSTVAVELYFDELVRVVLPMTKWWRRYVWRGMESSFQELLGGDFRSLLEQYFSRQKVAQELAEAGERQEDFELTPDLLWMMEIVGVIALAQSGGKLPRRRKPPEPGEVRAPTREVLDAVAGLLAGLVPLDPEASSLIWSVNRNRSATTSISRSTLAIKADAARLLFQLSCKDLRWAIVDSGVDARHPAFRIRDKDGQPLPLGDAGGDFGKCTRVVASYDFTRVRDILRPGGPDPAAMPPDMRARWEADPARAKEILENFEKGREVDWELMKELIEIPHKVADYRAPKNEHGTHVAGILAGDWRRKDPGMPEDSDLPGVCPDLYLYDLRVLKDDGSGDEFAVMSALQFVRHLNAHKDLMVVHGANCQPVDQARRRQLRLRPDAGLRGVRAAHQRRRRGGRRRRQPGLPQAADPQRPDRGLQQHLGHRPRQRRRRHHRRRHSPLPAAHLRRLLLLEPRADRRRAHQARPGRAGREDRRADPERGGQAEGRHEHGGAARQRRRRPAHGPLQRADRRAAAHQEDPLRHRDRPRPRALLPGLRHARRPACPAIGVTMIYTLEALNAKHGDSLLLHWGTPGSPRLIVIDGGPAGVYRRSLRPRLAELKESRSPGGPLDVGLLMVSHIDDDHVHGVLDLTRELVEAADDDRQPPWSIAGLWHNSFDDVLGNADAELTASLAAEVAAAGVDGDGLTLPLGHDAAAVVASVPQGRALRDDARRLGLEVNAPFTGLVLAPPDGDGAKVVRFADGLAFTIVGPSRARLEALHDEWEKMLRKLKAKSAEEASAIAAEFLDESVFNLSSIVVLAEAADRTMLLTGDARGDFVLEGLEAAGLLEAGEIHVDLFKVPHHGSDRNVDLDLFRRVTADHYVISADGRHGNPEVATLEMISEARGGDEFAIHLTNREDRLADYFAEERSLGKRYDAVFRHPDALSLRVELGDGLAD